jgi:hypothetical protein
LYIDKEFGIKDRDTGVKPPDMQTPSRSGLTAGDLVDGMVLRVVVR